jgi:hypothetical protein
MDGLAAATFEAQDAGSGPVHSSPNVGPMTTAIHNISVRHLHDISTVVPDDRQFLRSWRRNLQECLTQQNARIVQFLMADVSGDLSTTDITRRCNDILAKYSKPTWNFASSTRELSLPASITNATATIESELGIAPAALRDYMRKAIRLYANSAAALSSAEIRLEEKLKRLETLVGRVNDLMFMEPTVELEQMADPARIYLDSVLNKISIESEYKELVEQYKRFIVLKGVVSIGTFQKQSAPICTICLTKEVCQTVTPCGHTFCDDCSQKQMTSCFICRVQIRDKVRLYFS